MKDLHIKFIIYLLDEGRDGELRWYGDIDDLLESYCCKIARKGGDWDVHLLTGEMMSKKPREVILRLIGPNEENVQIRSLNPGNVLFDLLDSVRRHCPIHMDRLNGAMEFIKRLPVKSL
jgi:hypothetical protein